MSAAMAWDSASAAGIVAAHRERPGAMLPILHALQERFGYVDRAAVPVIAEALGLSRAEVHGVMSFYHDFRQAPVDGDVLALCRAEACQAMGCEDLGRPSRRRSWRPARRRGAGRAPARGERLLPGQLRARRRPRC